MRCARRLLAVCWLSSMLGCAGTASRPAETSHGPPPSWLEWLRPQAVLTYHVHTTEGQLLVARYRVARLEHRGTGVAALLIPMPDPDYGLKLAAHWLAGDERGLYRLERPVELADPNFVPLDALGRVRSSWREEARWALPRDWPSSEGDPSETWEVEELSMMVDGPVPGDRCASIRELGGDAPGRLTVCGKVGVVSIVRGPEEGVAERWELVAVGERPIRQVLQ